MLGFVLFYSHLNLSHPCIFLKNGMDINQREEQILHGGSIYPNPKAATILLPLAHHADIYFLMKRARILSPCVLSGETNHHNDLPSIDVLPDECLFEIFRRLHGHRERSTCASVSKRWLLLLSSILREEFYNRGSPMLNSVLGTGEDPDIEYDDCFLTRSLEGKRATDVRLASIAIGTGSCGGLGKLMISGCNPLRGVTNIGLSAIARSCPYLKVLSLWNVSSIGDEGLIEVANGCHQLKKFDLCSCPAVTDKALIAISQKCPNLAELTIESCLNVGNEGLRAIGKFCSSLKCLSAKDCPLVGDQGIASILSSATYTLTKVKLQTLNIGDVSLAIVGQYGKAVTDLVLASLPNTTEKGFWVMGKADGLQMLRTLSITSCPGFTDRGLEAVGKGCPNLKVFHLRKCALLSDAGLVSFAKVALSLENLQLEECHRITQAGIFCVLLACCAKLKVLEMVSCHGIKDLPFGVTLPDSFTSLQSLSICNCPGFGNINLGLLVKMCSKLRRIDLSGLHGITDAGLFPLIGNCDAGLVKVNLGGSINVTDEVVLTLTKVHGGTLKVLNLNGCRKITDASLVAIAEECMLVNELDVSKCAITDFGLASLAWSKCMSLQILSLSGCSMVSDKSFPFLMSLGQNLMGLSLQNCNGISSTVINMLMERLWRCDILS